MKKVLRHHARRVHTLLFPPLEEQNQQLVSARRRAEGDWAELFAQFDPLVAAADVLEIGCEDGALLASLLERRGDMARSAIGLEPNSDLLPTPGSALDQAHALLGDRLELHDRADYLDAFDPESFDLLICRSIESFYALPDLEAGLRKLYELLRPGGEALVVVHCCDPSAVEASTKGYGFLTPTSWLMLFLRAGFEIDSLRRIWRDDQMGELMADILPTASEQERMTKELRLRLVRPWEGRELEKVWATPGG